MDITRELAERVVTLRLEELPREVVDYTRSLTLSAFGAMIAGALYPSGQAVIRYVARQRSVPEATILGQWGKTSAELAALATGTFAHATEYEDDSFPEAVSSYTIFPAAFALGEWLQAPGKAVMEAFIAGYEVQARIGLATLAARRAGFMVLPLAGAIGCAATAARLLGLDTAKTTNALSLAASQAMGIGYQTGSGAHIVEMGFAARNGIAAALLAREGLTGQPDVLEAPRGLLNIITAGKVENPEGIVANWGKPFRLMEAGIKQYPCCYHLQRLIEAATGVRRDLGLNADDVKHIKVEVNAFFPTVVQHPEPHDEIEAQFSLPHAMAASFLDERVLPASFSVARINSPAHQAMRRRVETVIREDWGWTPTGWTPTMTFTLADGRVVTRQPTVSKGQPPKLLPFGEVIEKYENCLDPMLPRRAIDDSLAILERLEAAPDVGALIRAVSP